MSNFIGKREEEAGEVCDKLDAWVDSILGGAEGPRVTLQMSATTAAIIIGDVIVWNSEENSRQELNFEFCKDQFEQHADLIASFSPVNQSTRRWNADGSRHH